MTGLRADRPPLVLTAHGSADPRSADVAHAVAGRIRRLRPDLEVHAAFLERSAPNLRDVLTSVRAVPGARGVRAPVVTPMLLADAHHARVDIPAVIAATCPRAYRADVLGEDPALVHVLRQRLLEAGVCGGDHDTGVMVVAVGSSNAAANVRTGAVATALRAGTRWAGARVAFATGPRPSLADTVLRLRLDGARRVVIAPWFLAHGRITDRIADFARTHGLAMAEPLGSHNLVAATVLDRYEAVESGRIAA